MPAAMQTAIARFLKFSLGASVLSLVCAAAHAEQEGMDWKAAAGQDIRFIIDTIRERDAGAVSGRLDVTAPLAAGADAALVQAGKVQSRQDYRRVVAGFVDSFGDPHLGIQLHLRTDGWTGIVLDQVGSQYQVIWSEPGWPTALPPVGAVAQSCDGEWTGSYLKSNVAPFVSHSIEFPTTLSELARRSMFDTGLGWTPKTCRFTLADGSRRDFALPLRAVPGEVSDERIDEVKKHFNAAAKPVGVYHLGKDKLWLGMPNFNGRTSGAAYESMYRELARIKPGQVKWLVLDLRGNGGGDSSWGSRALETVYGKPYADMLGDMAGYRKELTANESTIALYKRYASLPEFASSRDETEKDLHLLEAARQAGQPMAEVDGMPLEEALKRAAQVRTRPAHTPRIAALINRNCFSSCMNVLQQVSAIGDTVVLGEPTLGYSAYGEIGSFDLPSGKGTIYVPNATFTAFQAPREPFFPGIAYGGNLADDGAVMAWVEKTLNGLRK